VALVGPGGVLVAGEEGEPAGAARALQGSGGGRSREESLLAVRAGDYVLAAHLPDAAGALAEFDLRCVASAVGVTVPR
jgi:hypothetical protein